MGLRQYDLTGIASMHTITDVIKQIGADRCDHTVVSFLVLILYDDYFPAIRMLRTIHQCPEQREALLAQEIPLSSSAARIGSRILPDDTENVVCLLLPQQQVRHWQEAAAQYRMRLCAVTDLLSAWQSSIYLHQLSDFSQETLAGYVWLGHAQQLLVLQSGNTMRHWQVLNYHQPLQTMSGIRNRCQDYVRRWGSILFNIAGDHAPSTVLWDGEEESFLTSVSQIDCCNAEEYRRCALHFAFLVAQTTKYSR